MTNKQYEHLGRALVAEARLETASEALDGLREELAAQLAAVNPDADADEWVRKQYGKLFAEFHGARNFMDGIRSIIAQDDKEVAE